MDYNVGKTIIKTIPQSSALGDFLSKPFPVMGGLWPIQGPIPHFVQVAMEKPESGWF